MYPKELLAEYPEVKDCFALSKQIDILKDDIDYWRKRFKRGQADIREKLLKEKEELFFVLSCPAKINEKRQSDTKAIFVKYATAAEQRIVPDSIKTRNTLIVITGIIILTAGIIIYKNKRS